MQTQYPFQNVTVSISRHQISTTRRITRWITIIISSVTSSDKLSKCYFNQDWNANKKGSVYFKRWKRNRIVFNGFHTSARPRSVQKGCVLIHYLQKKGHGNVWSTDRSRTVRKVGKSPDCHYFGRFTFKVIAKRGYPKQKWSG